MRTIILFIKIGILFSTFIFFNLLFNTTYATEYKINIDKGRIYWEVELWRFVTADIPDWNYNIKYTAKRWSKNSRWSMIYLNGTLIGSDTADRYNFETFNTSFNLEWNTEYVITWKANEWSTYFWTFELWDILLNHNRPLISNIVLSSTWVTMENEKTFPITLSWVLLEKQSTVNYQYSFDNLNFIQGEHSFSWASWINNFDLSIDLFDELDWDININLKLNDWTWDSITHDIILHKNTKPTTNFTILPINSELWTKKIIYTTSTWSIFYSKTHDQKCDDSLNFLEYTDNWVLMDRFSENNMYVCFKVNTWKTYSFFEITDIFNWITWVMPYKWGDVFMEYSTWKKDTKAKNNDWTLAFLKMTVSTSRLSSTNTDSHYPSSLVDINWDGLIDMLYTNYSYYTAWRKGSDWRSYDYKAYKYKYAIMINNWNYTFTPVYRCVIDDGNYYGDCVQ